MHRQSNKTKQAVSTKGQKKQKTPTKVNMKRKVHTTKRRAVSPLSSSIALTGASMTTNTSPLSLMSTTTRSRRQFTAQVDSIASTEGSDPAFGAQPKQKQEKSQTEQEQDDILQQIDAVVKAYPVVLFMKGTPSEPRCGFSRRVVQILHEFDLTYEACNVLESDELREAVKTYSNWPTLPQLYVGGEFVGGCDIITQMYQSGELAEVLPTKPKKTDTEEVAKDQAV